MYPHLYRYIEDGQIKGGPKALPTNWRDKGDALLTMTDEERKAEGWLPNIVNDLRVQGEVDAGWTDELFEDRVVQTLHSQPAPERDPLEIETAMVAEAQRRLDDFAVARGYDDIKSLVTYADDPDPTFAAEGAIGKATRSAMWAAMRDYKLLVLAGSARVPLVLDDIPGLPRLRWD